MLEATECGPFDRDPIGTVRVDLDDPTVAVGDGWVKVGTIARIVLCPVSVPAPSANAVALLAAFFGWFFAPAAEIEVEVLFRDEHRSPRGFTAAADPKDPECGGAIGVERVAHSPMAGGRARDRDGCMHRCASIQVRDPIVPMAVVEGDLDHAVPERRKFAGRALEREVRRQRRARGVRPHECGGGVFVVDAQQSVLRWGAGAGKREIGDEIVVETETVAVAFRIRLAGPPWPGSRA